jgi:outer membrane protein assembly factor BamB
MARLTLVLAAGLAVAADWPQWLGPQRDGVWREDGIVDALPPGGPPKLWSVPVGLGYAGPAVAGGKVFVTDRTLGSGQQNPANPFDAKTPVGGTERVRALDERTGRELWSHEYPCTYTISYAAGPRCTPTVDGDRVYSLGAMGDLVCLNTSDGKVIWRKNLPADYAAKVPVWGFACHPLVDGDHLIVVGGGPDKLVIAFDKATGKEAWASQNCEGDFGYSPPMIYEFGGRRQLIVWHARAVVGLDPATGKRIWSVPFEVKAALTAPTARKVGDDRLFVTSFYNGSLLLKVTTDAATVVWKSKARGERPNQTTDLSSIIATPFVDGETIYGVDSYGELRALDANTGRRRWMTMQATRGALTPPAAAASDEPTDKERWSNAFIVRQADRYFLFNEQGDLITAKLTPDGYTETSRAHLIDPTNTMAQRKVVWMHPAFADRCVFVRNDRELIAYNLAK